MLDKRFFTGKNIVFIGLVILLLLILPKIAGILMLFFGAYVIACALNPYVTKLMIKMKNRTAASSLVLLGSISAIVALFIPIIFVAYKEIKTFMITLPEKITDVTNFPLETLNFTGINYQRCLIPTQYWEVLHLSHKGYLINPGILL